MLVLGPVGRQFFLLFCFTLGKIIEIISFIFCCLHTCRLCISLFVIPFSHYYYFKYIHTYTHTNTLQIAFAKAVNSYRYYALSTFVAVKFCFGLKFSRIPSDSIRFVKIGSFDEMEYAQCMCVFVYFTAFSFPVSI